MFLYFIFMMALWRFSSDKVSIHNILIVNRLSQPLSYPGFRFKFNFSAGKFPQKCPQSFLNRCLFTISEHLKKNTSNSWLTFWDSERTSCHWIVAKSFRTESSFSLEKSLTKILSFESHKISRSLILESWVGGQRDHKLHYR